MLAQFSAPKDQLDRLQKEFHSQVFFFKKFLLVLSFPSKLDPQSPVSNKNVRTKTTLASTGAQTELQPAMPGRILIFLVTLKWVLSLSPT